MASIVVIADIEVPESTNVSTLAAQMRRLKRGITETVSAQGLPCTVEVNFDPNGDDE